MKRARVLILLLLLIGIVINLGVAWSCALWWPLGKDWSRSYPDAIPEDLAALPEVAAWAQPSRRGSVGVMFSREVSRGLGIGIDSLGVQEMVPGLDTMGPGRVRRSLRAGWPLASMSCIGYVDWMMNPRDPARVPPDWRGGVSVPEWLRPEWSGPEVFFFDVPRPLPLRVLPLGFAVDSVFYAIVAGCVVFVPGVIRRARRGRRGLCRACEYPINGLAVCPECGRPVDPQRAANLIS